MKFFLILLPLLLVSFASAQDASSIGATSDATATPSLKANQIENDLGVFVGLSYTDVQTDGSESVDASLGYRAGIISVAGLTEKLSLRYGLGYSSREFTSETGGVETKFKFNYADIPIAIQYKISDMFNVYAGSVLAVNVNKKTESAGTEGKVELLKNVYPMIQLGGNLKFTPECGLDVYYETGFSGLIRRAPNANYSIFGVNFIYWL